MFDEIDQEYYRRRALAAHARAAEAVDPAIASVHRNFAEEYERKAAAARASRPIPMAATQPRASNR